MTHLRRAPDWEQSADRRSVLQDPVLTVRQLSRLGFVPRRLTRIDHALVFSTAGGAYVTCLPPLRPSRREVISRRYTSVYEVDLGVHPLVLKLALPSDNDALQFEAAVELTWQVSDPAVFVASGVRNVPRLLLSEWEQSARSVTRGFRVADSAEAEAEVLRAVRARPRLGAAAGLIVTWTLRLHRDRDNIEHQRRMQAIDHAAGERIHSERRGMAQDAETDRRVRRQDELKAQRALVYGKHQHALLLQQQQWEAELREGELSKIDFYRKQLEQGGVRAWALHLAEHPEDSQLVVRSLREDQVNMIRAKADMVAKLLGGDEAESYELEGPKQLALRALNDILDQQLPGATADRGPGIPRLPVDAVGPDHGRGPAADSAESLSWPPGCTPTTGASEAGPRPSASLSARLPEPTGTAAGSGRAPDAHDASGQDAPQSPAGMFPGWRPPPGYLTGQVPPARPTEAAPVPSHHRDETSEASAEENQPGGGRR